MHLTGVTKDALFEVAHTTRNYALNNPNAFFYQRPFDRAKYHAAVIYDAFSPIVLCQIETWNFCGFGESGDFVLDGAMRPEGRLPTNTHGGQLSEA